MRTIAVVNQKGGVAKTSTVINVAAILAKDYKKRVLVIDADSQHNSTDFLGGDAEKTNLADLLRDPHADGGDAAWALQAANFPGIELIAGSDALMDLDLTSAKSPDVNVAILRLLREEIESWGKDGPAPFDVCLIDCPPAFNAASAAGLLMADEVLIPIKLDRFSVSGMANVMRQIANARQVHPALHVLGVLPVLWKDTEETREWEQTFRDSALRVFPHIRQSDKVDTATRKYRPLVVCSPTSGACVDYRRFVHELMKGAVDNG